MELGLSLMGRGETGLGAERLKLVEIVILGKGLDLDYRSERGGFGRRS